MVSGVLKGADVRGFSTSPEIVSGVYCGKTVRTTSEWKLSTKSTKINLSIFIKMFFSEIKPRDSEKSEIPLIRD